MGLLHAFLNPARAVVLVAVVGAAASADVSPHAGMLRTPGVSATHIAFVYANDIWVVPRAGGQAVPLASPPGLEWFPRFSPDGQTIAFVGNYDGNRDLYTIPLAGGTPTRVTHHPGGETLTGWTPDGKGLVFFSNGLAGRNRVVEFFTVPAAGGMPEKMSVPYGANGAVSPDGQWLAYTPHTIDTRTWKRYRGGMATAVWLFNLKDFSSKKITDWEGMCTLPMWSPKGDAVYYLSDEGPAHRLNIWAYDLKSGKRTQVTTFTDDDVKWPSIGPGDKGQGEIVFQLGDSLQLLDLGAGKSRAVTVTIPGDRPKIREHSVDAGKFVQHWAISPTGKRAAVSARGDLWSLPAEKGSPRNMTRTSGVAERDPEWSPDGRWIAYFSDVTGEYELYIRPADGKGEPKQLTKDSKAFKLQPVWSPDSKKIVYTEKTGTLFLVDVESGEQKKITKDPWSGGAEPIHVSWSHDSRWLTYAKSSEQSQSNSVWIYNVETGEAKQVTSGFFNSTEPVFDRRGEYLFFVTNRSFRPMYGEIDQSFIYAATEVLAAVPLKADTKSPWAPTSDEEKPAEKKKDDKKDEKKDGEKKDEAKPDEAKKDDADKKNGDEKKPEAKKEAAADDGVSGTWEGTATGGPPLPPGGVPMTFTLTLGKDGTVSGSVSTPMGGGSVSGTYDAAGKVITLTLSIAGAPPGTFTGAITGGTVKGTLSAPELGFSGSFEGKRTSTGGGGDEKKDGEKKDDGKPKEKVEIDFDGFEARAMMIPVKAGNFSNLAVNDKNDLLYARTGFRGSEESASIKIFSLKDEKKEEKNVASGSANFHISADGKKILIAQGNTANIQDAAAGATGKPVVVSGMNAEISPREEWRQIFTDAWRIQRDYFYVENMHGVDWAKQREHYGKMIDDCNSREDVSYVISEMISELNVGHAYYNGGDVESAPSVSVGLLGCDYERKNGAYQISRILRGAAWDMDAKGPLSQPGVDVKEGMYLLAVNGVAVNAAKDPWAAFVGLGGKTVTITVGPNPAIDDKAKEVVVETITSEENLRYRAWIEEKRAYVAEKSGGKIGYIYVPSTALDGQNDLVRQFYGQMHLPALMIDERWNSGGQIPTRFIELLNRPRTNYWARRDGKDWGWPPDSHQGPKAMLINGLSGSGGDAFPYYFKQAGLGKLVGTRTWGGLVGISGNPGLIDGGSVTVPTFGFYKLDGNWGIEGHGVDPDMEVIDDPALMAKGSPKYKGIGDPQIDAALDHLMKEIQAKPYSPPKTPAAPDRKGMGIPAEQR